MSRLSFITAAIILCALGCVVLAAGASAQSSSTARIVAVDADITGNTATSLGPLNACTRVEPGSTATVDVVVDAVPQDRGLIGMQFTLLYDANILTLTKVNSEFLLAANGSFEPFEGIADPLPDSDGRYTYIVADLASNPPFENIESGPGVLARVTFTTKAAGISNVALSFNPPDDYPSLIDHQNDTIGVDSIGTARIAVGQDCDIAPAATPVIQNLPPIGEIEGLATPKPTPSPVNGTPGPSPSDTGSAGSPGPTGSAAASPGTGNDPGITTTDNGDGGTGAGTIVAAVALGIAGLSLAGGGVWLLLRRRRAGPGLP